ncbi:MAG: CBS domain-containing protein [Desulfobacterales bacterium]|nr:CBS domain-containing protein [Desulfobacterales bacterium]
MLKIKDIMTEDPITVFPETELTHITKILLEKHINGVPVTDETGKLVGIICQSDLIAQQKKLPLPSFFTILDGLIPLTSMKQLEKEVKKVSAATVSDIMTPAPITVTPDDNVETVATLMVEKKFHSVPVVDNGELVGIVGKEDILRTLIPELSDSQDT